MLEWKTDTHKFTVFIDNEKVSDMKSVASELVSFGYKKIQSFEYEGNTILIYAKKIEKSCSS